MDPILLHLITRIGLYTDPGSCKLDENITIRSICRSRLALFGAILLISLAPAGRLSGAVDSPSADPRDIPALEVGELVVDSVVCPYDLVFRDQQEIRVHFNVLNVSGTNILIQNANLLFSIFSPGDRNIDYEVEGDLNPNLVIPPGTEHTFEFVVSSYPWAILDTEIRIDGLVNGRRLDTFEIASDSTATAPHTWMVVVDGINAVVALFDTRLTSERSDDSLICFIDGENFQFDTDHYLNGGRPIGGIALDGLTIYRLVLQICPSMNWEWEPKDSEEGFMKIDGINTGFGRLSAQRAGIKELLVPDFLVPDEETDPADFVRGATHDVYPSVPWNMLTDPWVDPHVDDGKTNEVGSILESLTHGYIIDCVDDGEHWEVTGKCEWGRYYFYEAWFQPDLEWTRGETVDISLTLLGANDESDLDALHLLFGAVDDDSIPPHFSDFTPEIIPSEVPFDITCRISDPSGVYDDDTGYGGQGVYLLWDDDGSLTDDFNELQMSHIGGGIFQTDSPIGSRNDGDVIIFEVHACDDDTDAGDVTDRSCGHGGTQNVQVVSDVYLSDEPGSLYPNSVYAGESGVSIHVDFANPTIYDIELDTTSMLSFSDSTYDVIARLANRTVIPPGAVNFPVSFEPVDIPEGFEAPSTCYVRFDLLGSYNGGAEVFHQSWIASSRNMLFVLEPILRFTPHALPSSPVHPGDDLVELLRFEVTSEAPTDLSLDSLIVSNTGTGSISLRNLNMSGVYLYRQSSSLLETRMVPESNPVDPAKGEGLSDDPIPGGLLTRPFSGGDSLVATGRFGSGSIVFRLSSGNIMDSGESAYFYVLADVDSFLARDGDGLDVAVVSEDSVFVTGHAMVSFETTPLNSEGVTPIDGFMPFQMEAEASIPDTIFTTDSNQAVLSMIIPVNGYSPDVLSAVSLKHYGDEEVVVLVESLRLWLDDGDGVFSSGADSLLGKLVPTGDLYQISGIFLPVT